MNPGVGQGDGMNFLKQYNARANEISGDRKPDEQKHDTVCMHP